MIEVNYTTYEFEHLNNNPNNSFTIPNDARVNWYGTTNARFKWPDKERLTITINSNDTSGFSDRYYATRFRIRNNTGKDTNWYYYFVDSVIKNNDGSVVIELSLDYFLTYYLTTFFGTSTSQWFGYNYSIPFMVERSHLMPDPSSFIGALATGHYERLTNWNKYVLLLQTLKRVDFDIAGYINEVIYSNKNFLQVAAGQTYSQLRTIRINSVSPNNTLNVNCFVPWTTASYRGAYLTYQGVSLLSNVSRDTYNIEIPHIPFINNFNNTTTWLVMPYPKDNYIANRFSFNSNGSVLEITSTLPQNSNNNIILIPAPIDSNVYTAYVNGLFTGLGACIIDSPLPHIVALMNKCYEATSLENTISSNIPFNLGFYRLKNSNGTIVDSLGLLFNRTTFIIENLLTKVLGNNSQIYGLASVEQKPGMNDYVIYQNWRDFLVDYTPNQNTTDFFLFKGLNSVYFTFKQGYLCFSFQDYNTFRYNSENICLMINLVGFNASIISKGDIYKGNDTNLNVWYDNSNTQWLAQANTTLTKGYGQWLSVISNDNEYANIMNTKYNSINTSLANTRNQTVVQSILGAFGILGGVGGITYGITHKSVNSFMGGALGAWQGFGNVMNSVVGLGNAQESYNSYLKDSANANSGYLFQNDIPAIPALPTASQVVINKLGQVRLWNWVNRNGYDINEVFSARHINLNNLKYDKYLDNNNTIQNLQGPRNYYRNKYGFLKFYDFCAQNIRRNLIKGFKGKNFVIASNHIEWWVGLMVNGFSFHTSD